MRQVRISQPVDKAVSRPVPAPLSPLACSQPIAGKSLAHVRRSGQPCLECIAGGLPIRRCRGASTPDRGSEGCTKNCRVASPRSVLAERRSRRPAPPRLKAGPPAAPRPARYRLTSARRRTIAKSGWPALTRSPAHDLAIASTLRGSTRSATADRLYHSRRLLWGRSRDGFRIRYGATHLCRWFVLSQPLRHHVRHAQIDVGLQRALIDRLAGFLIDQHRAE